MEGAILFDFGGTLDCPAHWLDRFLAHYCTVGLELDRAILDRAFTAATAFAYRTTDRMRDFDLAATIRYLVRHQLATLRETDTNLRAAIDAIGVEHAEATISASFAAESLTGLAASRAVLERLAVRFQLAIVSNFYGNLDRILDQSGLMPLVTFVADSSRLGSFKPDYAIFNAALQALETRSDHILMVGDSLTKDCAPAHALGLRTAWLRYHTPGHPELGPRPPVVPDFTIDALAELQDLKWINS
jgi:FMN phosphatase YigB (HAD superfamily)